MAEAEDKPERAPSELALVLASPAPLRFAGSLEEADGRSVVVLDRNGDVLSRPQIARAQVLAWTTASSIAIAGAAVYASLFGPAWGLVAGAVFGGALVRGMARARKLRAVTALIAESRLGEAEALCRGELARRFAPRGTRAYAHHNLGVIAWRRGDFTEALSEVRTSIRLRHSGFRRSVQVDVLAYFEIQLLVNLGRLGEARARLGSRGPVPDGEFLRLMHWSADLAVQFGENHLGLDDDEIWERSRRALQLSVAPNFIALCAWAAAERGDPEMSDHLLGEAIERAQPDSARGFPSLWSWVESRRPRLPSGS